MAALLTIESQNSDKIALYLAECRELGVPVLPPDINRSELAVHRASRRACASASAPSRARARARSSRSSRRARALGGRITSLFALAEHVDLRLVNKKVLEAPGQGRRVRRAGAGGRRGLPGVAPAAARRARSHPRSRQPPPEGSRPGPVAAVRRRRRRRRRADDDAALPAVAPWTETEALTFEKEALGLYMSGHPLQRYAEALAAAGARRLARPDAVGGRRARSAASSPACGRSRPSAAIAWRCSCSRTRPPRSKRSCSRRRSRRFGALVAADAMLLVRGKYERDEETEPPGRVARSRRSRSCASAPCARSRSGWPGTGSARTAMRAAGRRARAASRRSPRVVRRAT